ncbi:MAG: FHA domain-containing protein [Planctomycetes bacterium]|nr:FHA domain-containing protein [Planctomycetota bacterium]
MSCGVPIQHPRISRRHAEIECTPEGTFLTDLGSANGTLRNGSTLLGRTRLLSGDRVHVGPVEIRVGEHDEAFHVTPAPAAALSRESESANNNIAPTPGSKRIRKATRNRSLVPVLLGCCLLAAGAWGLWESGVLANLERTTNNSRDAGETGEASLEELVPPDASQSGRQHCAAAFMEALAAARYEEAESLALSPQAPADLATKLRAALTTLVRDLKQDAESMAQNSTPALAAAHLRSASATLPRGSFSRRELEAEAHRYTLRSEELAEQQASKDVAQTEAAKPETKPETGAPPAIIATGAATTEDAAAAASAWQQRDLQSARRLAGTIIAGRSTPAVRRAAERVLRCVEDHELLADALSAGLSKVPERRWPGQSGAAALRSSRAGLAAQNAAGVSELPWKVVSADLMAAAVQAAGLDPAAQVAAARVLRELGHAAAADELLSKALQRDAALRPRVDRTLADGLDLAEVPTGGFVWLSGAWITANDAARRTRREDMDKDAGLLASSKAEVRDPAFERLLALGNLSKASLRRGLLQARATVLIELRKVSGFEQVERLAAQRLELDTHRAHALELIFDTTRYPYPYRPPEADAAAQLNYRENQPEVARRVKVVSDIWGKAEAVALAPALRKLVTRLDEYGAMAARAEIDFEDEFAWLSLLPEGREVSLTTIALNPKDRERIDSGTEALRLNQSSPGIATPGEREQCRITNEYRLMMGGWALRLYDRLTRASRGHCADMTRLGFFAHDSPVPGKSSPMDRVLLTGMQPEGMSENIAISAGAAAAHSAWIRSPGHHRNILMPAWRLMGPGNSGSHWCQNFSIRDRAPAEEAGR